MAALRGGTPKQFAFKGLGTMGALGHHSAVAEVMGMRFSGLLAWRAHAWPAIAYGYTSYKVDAQGIEIRRGVFWRTITSIPRSRVQHTDVSQGPLQRTHELGTLVVYTAGTDHARVDLSGLAHARALLVREHLLPKGEADAI